MVRLSAICTGRLLPPGRIPGTYFCHRLRRPEGDNATGRIKSLKNSSDCIGNRSCDPPACSAAPQPTAPPRTPNIRFIHTTIEDTGKFLCKVWQLLNTFKYGALHFYLTSCDSPVTAMFRWFFCFCFSINLSRSCRRVDLQIRL